MHMKKKDSSIKPWKSTENKHLELFVPANYLMLCSLFDIEPEKLLNDFMSTLGGESFGLGDKEKKKAKVYFMHCKYGRDLYSKKDILAIFKEVHAISTLWPEEDNYKILDLHTEWRNKYHKYWYKKWFHKARRINK